MECEIRCMDVEWKQWCKCIYHHLDHHHHHHHRCLFNEASLNSIVYCIFKPISVYSVHSTYNMVSYTILICVRLLSVVSMLHASFQMSCVEENHKMPVAITTDCLFDSENVTLYSLFISTWRNSFLFILHECTSEHVQVLVRNKHIQHHITTEASPKARTNFALRFLCHFNIDLKSSVYTNENSRLKFKIISVIYSIRM